MEVEAEPQAVVSPPPPAPPSTAPPPVGDMPPQSEALLETRQLSLGGERALGRAAAASCSSAPYVGSPRIRDAWPPWPQNFAWTRSWQPGRAGRGSLFSCLQHKRARFALGSLGRRTTARAAMLQKSGKAESGKAKPKRQQRRRRRYQTEQGWGLAFVGTGLTPAGGRGRGCRRAA